MNTEQVIILLLSIFLAALIVWYFVRELMNQKVINSLKENYSQLVNHLSYVERLQQKEKQELNLKIMQSAEVEEYEKELKQTFKETLEILRGIRKLIYEHEETTLAWGDKDGELERELLDLKNKERTYQQKLENSLKKLTDHYLACEIDAQTIARMLPDEVLS